MSRVFRSTLALAVAVTLLASASAFGQQGAKKRANAAKRAAENQVFQLPKDITLTAEQQTKLQSLKDEYAPKLAALNAKQAEVLTAEQQAARAEVTKANRQAKKTGKEAQEAVSAAMKLTDEQKTKWAAAQKEVQELRKVIEQKKRDLLTEEQKAKLPKQRRAAK